MSKSNSAALHALSKDAMAGPSPYGTRSRNRGQARPNYAEDKDLDVEMEDAFPEKKEEEPKKGIRQASAATNGTGDATKVTAPSSRKSVAADDFKSATSHATGKDAHSTAPATANATGPAPSSGSSKKRKATAQATTNNVHSQASTPTPTLTTAAVTGTRRGAAQATPHTGGYRETNMLSFERCGGMPKDGKMIADDGTVLAANDHVYLVCEPPGEPYYLGRIMEFLHVQNDSKKPVDALRINWYYRPKDIGKRVNDTRLVFATMHSDISPLTSLRGKCQIRHKAEIDDPDAYRTTPDCFWYEKLYDRYIQKHYDVIPCFQIVNVPEKVKKVLDERWKYILVEQGRGKEYTSAVKLCKRCNGYCASNDSVDCAVCQQTYHMNCVRPPLLKKPSRGFAWACAACSLAQERKLEARHTPLLDSHVDGEEEEVWDDDDEAINTTRTSPTDGIDDSHQPATPEQIYQASLWPYRYLGQHCKPEDALDYDDRIYPRAGSRLGTKHQATVLSWPGRPVKLVKPIETKRPGKKDGKSSKDAIAAAEVERVFREERPWIQDEPAGYVARGEDLDNDDPNNTAQLLWKPCDDTVVAPHGGFPKSKPTEDTPVPASRINKYIRSSRAKLIPVLGLPKESTNFLDVAINTLFKNDFKTDAALRALDGTGTSAFKEPELTPVEIKKFEEGVAKFGSELYLVTKHVKAVDHARIVRFYYAWKKTDRGKQIWGNFSGRKGKKEVKKAEADASKMQDDVANDHDDSAFDTDKALERKRSFMCKFCSTKVSRQWRRAPHSASTVLSEAGGKGAHKDKIQYIVALCRRCAELWRRYAIQWEDIEDLSKKVATAGGRSWKRKVDEELLKELVAAEEMMNLTVYTTSTRASPATRATPPAANTQSTSADLPPPRKKLKTIGEKHSEQSGGDAAGSVVPPPPKKKEKPVEKPPPPPPPPPPPAPELPKLRTLPCAICYQGSVAGEHVICCKECRLTVHRSCYGTPDSRNKGKWTCDMCLNDKVPQVSIEYKCVLCPVERTEHDFIEPPKNTHKKKTEKDREKERVDRELALKAVELYQKRQVELRRPVNPREPLKRTVDNNWVHVTCAVWTPEIKFSSAKALCVSEGIPSIPRARHEEVCKVCKERAGACVLCHSCRAPVHVECAHKSGYLLGFEITPVKGSRRDQHNIVTIGGETGSMSALIWCKEHIPQKTVVHRMHDIVKAGDGQPSDANALQLYVRNFKQADLTLTGTVRKANLANVIAKPSAATLPANQNRRHSSTTVPTSTLVAQKGIWHDFQAEAAALIHHSGEKVCITCGIDVSPRWHGIDGSQEKILTNGYAGTVGDEARKFLAQRHFQCHKCKREGRQPVAHVASPVEAPATIEPLRPPPIINPSPAPNSPHHASHAVSRIGDLGSPWGPRATPTQPPVPLGPTPLHSSPGVQPQSLPLTAPRQGPSPIAAPGPPPAPAHNYPAPSSSYGEWQRGSTQPPVAPHPISAGSGGPSSIHHNHLRDLRPPPITSIPHHQVGHIQHGIGQPMVNGVPPSSPRRAPLTIHNNGGASFVTSYHPPTHPPLHSLTNGSPAPRTSDHSFSQGLLSQRPPFSTTPHRSPPVSRDGITMNHEQNINNINNSNSVNAPPRPNDARPANGASASPSLRNLLI